MHNTVSYVAILIILNYVLHWTLNVKGFLYFGNNSDLFKHELKICYHYCSQKKLIPQVNSIFFLW